MFVVCVTIFVKPGHADDFIAASLKNAKGTRSEEGNLRFDILRCHDDENQFFLYEAYRTEDDFKNHQRTPHYLAWKECVAGWMAKNRIGVKHTSVFPVDDEW